MADPSHYHDAMESFVTSRLCYGTSGPSEELKQRARELIISVSPTGAIANKLPFLMALPETLVPTKAWERRRERTERRFFEYMQQRVVNELAASRAAPKATTKPSWMRMYLENKRY